MRPQSGKCLEIRRTERYKQSCRLAAPEFRTVEFRRGTDLQYLTYQTNNGDPWQCTCQACPFMLRVYALAGQLAFEPRQLNVSRLLCQDSLRNRAGLAAAVFLVVRNLNFTAKLFANFPSFGCSGQVVDIRIAVATMKQQFPGVST